MASETDVPEASFLERLISSRNRDLALFLPFILGFTNITNNSNPDQDSQNHDQQDQDTPTPREEARDRVILINPFTQGMVVIEGRGSTGLDALLRDLFGGGGSSKDGQPPASKASIEAMKSVEICEGNDEGECVICLEEWGIGQLAKEMPCKHKFHGNCVETWLKIHGTCPICRYKMPIDEDDDDLNKKTENQERGRRRDIWVSFSFGSGGRRGGQSNQTGSDESSE